MQDKFHIGPWLVQPREGMLTRGEQSARLEPKTMAVLELLAAFDGAVVSRSDLMDAVWPNQDVTDDVLTSCISILRRELGDNRRDTRYIETLPKRGYRLLVKVTSSSPDAPANNDAGAKDPALFWNKWGLAGLGAFVVTLALALGFLWPVPDSTPPISAENRSIAVLPLDVFSDQEQMAHFASGLEEELIHQLATDPGLRVIARTSSSRFQDQQLSIREISEILGVRHVIEGSVRDGPDGVRITIQLIDAETDSHLWSRVFDVGSDHLIGVQEQVGVAVSKLMAGSDTELTDDPAFAFQPPRHPVPDAAYRMFLLGEAHMRVGTGSAYREASGYFADAIHIAPDYALAYSRLAAAHMLLYQYDGEPLEQAAQQARKALDKALEIDPGQAEALATLGLMYTYQKKYRAAEEHFLQALERQPNLRFALHNYGFMLWSEARFKEALVYLEEALRIDPLSDVTNYLVGDSLVGVGDFDAARVHYEKCMKVLPVYYACPAGLSSLQRLQGDYQASGLSLQHAGSLVDEGYFWHDLALALQSLHRADYQASETLLSRAALQFPLSYELLRTRLLLSLATGQLDSFVAELHSQLEVNPSDRDLRMIAVLASSYAGDCATAVGLHESEALNPGNLLVNIWDLESGFSYAANLAFCFGQLGRHSAQAVMLGEIEQYLESVSGTSVPGQIFLQARYFSLADHDQQAVQTLNRLRDQGWPLLWMSDLLPAPEPAL